MIYRTVMLLLFWSTAAAAAPQPVAVNVGPDRAWLLEAEFRDAGPGTYRWPLSDLPAGTRWHTLRLYTPLGRTRMLLRDHAAKLKPQTGAGPFSFQAVPRTPAKPVAEVQVFSGGRQPCFWMYETAGWNWRAHYTAQIRTASNRPTASVDFSAMAVISNGTRRVCPDVRVVLTGTHRRPAEDEGVGFLMIPNQHPLHAQGRLNAEPAAMEGYYYYEIEAPVRLPTFSQTAVPLVAPGLRRGRKLYVMHSDRFPLSLLKTEQSLDYNIVLENTADNGLGKRLPAGPVQVEWGGCPLRGRPAPWLPHTEPGRRVRLELGRAAGVGGYRRLVSRAPPEAGAVEMVYEVTVNNRLTHSIPVEIYETPPLLMKWDVLECSEPFSRNGDQLHFEWQVPPNTKASINYRVKVYKPEI